MPIEPFDGPAIDALRDQRGAWAREWLDRLIASARQHRGHCPDRCVGTQAIDELRVVAEREPEAILFTLADAVFRLANPDHADDLATLHAIADPQRTVDPR